MFLGSFNCQIWAIFTLVLFGHRDKIHPEKRLGFRVGSNFSDFLPYLPSKSSKCNNTEMLWKIQEICSKMGTKLFEIDEKMSEIIDAKVGNPQNSTSIK